MPTNSVDTDEMQDFSFIGETFGEYSVDIHQGKAL